MGPSPNNLGLLWYIGLCQGHMDHFCLFSDYLGNHNSWLITCHGKNVSLINNNIWCIRTKLIGPSVMDLGSINCFYKIKVFSQYLRNSSSYKETLKYKNVQLNFANKMRSRSHYMVPSNHQKVLSNHIFFNRKGYE